MQYVCSKNKYYCLKHPPQRLPWRHGKNAKSEIHILEFLGETTP